jgi:hypothetical protein
MPVKRCTRNGERGWQCGGLKCFIPSEEGSDAVCKEKAEKQCRAIHVEESATMRSLVKDCTCKEWI